MRKTKRLHLLESLEHRFALTGDVGVTVVSGDLIVTGDTLDNQIEIRQLSYGNYEITGQAGTLINGAPSFLAKRVRDDFSIDMAQGGADAVKLIGALRVPDRLDVVMGHGGDLQILGTTGVLRIGGVVDIHSAAPGDSFDLMILDQVRFDEKVSLTGCDFLLIQSQGQLVGPTFDGTLTVKSCEDMEIRSFEQSIGPRFEEAVILGDDSLIDTFDVSIGSYQDSVGPRFDGLLQMVMGESAWIESSDRSIGPRFEGPVRVRSGDSVRIESHDDSTGPRFDEPVDAWAAINVVVQSHHASTGPQFRAAVTFEPADDVFVFSHDDSRGATFYGKSTFVTGVGVVVWSAENSVGPVFLGKVDMKTGYDVSISSRDTSVGPSFRQPLTIAATTDVYIDAWENSVGPSFYAAVRIDAGTSVYIGSIFDATGPTFKAPLTIAAGEDLSIQRFAGTVTAASASFTQLTATVGGNALLASARFSRAVTIQMADDDNLLRVVDSIFAKLLRADGGLGADTFEDGFNNIFTGGMKVTNFETMLP